MLKEQRECILYILTESSDKSKTKSNYKPKGYKKITEFTKIDIHDSKVFTYVSKSLSKQIKHILSYKGDGYVFIDENSKNALVGYIFVSKQFVCPIRVCSKYTGYGLSKQIMKIAINEFHAKYLWCATDNEIALKLYKSLGFRIDPEESDDKYYKMILG